MIIFFFDITIIECHLKKWFVIVCYHFQYEIIMLDSIATFLHAAKNHITTFIMKINK